MAVTQSKGERDSLIEQLSLLLKQARAGGSQQQPTMIALTANQVEKIVAILSG